MFVRSDGTRSKAPSSPLDVLRASRSMPFPLIIRRRRPVVQHRQMRSYSAGASWGRLPDADVLIGVPKRSAKAQSQTAAKGSPWAQNQALITYQRAQINSLRPLSLLGKEEGPLLAASRHF
uniref:Uncharacterized protein n=1 Tax=Steinernema glaseri TaxID=37863 RepID=A0A1I8AVV0_9BILA